MARQIVTANRLSDGRVVYLTASAHWSEDPAGAAVAPDSEAAKALLARAEADAARARVVAPYLIELSEDPGVALPRRYRERIRAAGPSVRPDLGRAAASGPS